MSPEHQKLKRQQYLQAVLQKFIQEEPKLSLKEICEVLVFVLGDIRELLKQIAKENKKV